MARVAPKVLIPMADYGHDPTETAIPYKAFLAAGFTVDFATEAGKPPRCDSRMLYGLVGALLGANKEAKAAYHSMIASESKEAGSINHPHAWSSETFSLADYDLVFLPGGHDKGVRQVIEAKPLHDQLAKYFPQTIRSGFPPSSSASSSSPKKTIAAICHGVQVLAFTPNSADSNSSKSVIHDAQTTALPAFMEQSIFWLTRFFLGDYYKTYGAGSKSVQRFVEDSLDSPEQFLNSPSYNFGEPFIVEDPKYRYLSGRFPPDAWLLARRVIETVNEERQE